MNMPPDPEDCTGDNSDDQPPFEQSWGDWDGDDPLYEEST